jgi:hypothetical protein
MKNRTAIFLLSPAYAGGERARMLLSDQAEFELARKLRDKQGAPIAEVFGTGCDSPVTSSVAAT